MPSNNAVDQINFYLSKLEQGKDLDTALALAVLILKEADPSAELPAVNDVKEEVFDLSQHGTSKIESWFKEHPYLGGHRVALLLHAQENSKIESRFFHLNQKISKQVIAGAVQIVPNWEDGALYHYDSYKVGIDFFLAPDGASLMVVVSKDGNLRVVELAGRLSTTQVNILQQIANAGDLPTNQAVHETLWNAFAIREVNKTFYKGVSQHFSELLQYLHAENGKPLEEAKLFSSRLLGRLLFVWFLRKKGLIDESIGYFDVESYDATDYYNKILKQLFFHTLNKDKGERTLFSDNTTPYLNGGLFEAQASDWSGENIRFPQGFFKRLYDHFDQFNFTTDESSPEYEQVAIDPEMLGRVFESLLASQRTETGDQARNARGTFYTPREIVSYICKETLREYLYGCLEDTSLYEGIDKLIDATDAQVALSHTNFRRDLWGEHRSKEVVPKIISCLDQLTVLDPACGSGAFPMGMVQLLVRTYERLESRFDPYKTKLKIIQDTIFGVDIEPMAVEIARLRTWLSLVVDEKNLKEVEPLPNLDFKFVCADTLLRLDSATGLFTDHSLDEKLASIRERYFRARKSRRKLELQTQYESLTAQLQTALFEDQRTAQLRSFDPFRNTQPAGYFDTEYMFGVQAFDAVIGNPPYIRIQELHEDDKESYRAHKYETYTGRGDIYTLFYERGVELLKAGGVLGYITSNKWMRADYGKNLRSFLIERTHPKQVIDLGAGVFDSATVDTNVMLLTKSDYTSDTQALAVKSDFDITKMRDYVRKNAIPTRFIDNGNWVVLSELETRIRDKLLRYGKPLHKWDLKINYGIKSGLNAAFIIDKAQRDELITQDPASAALIRPILRGRDISRYATVTNPDKYLINVHNGYREGDTVVPAVAVGDYPAIKDWLDSFQPKLMNRSDQGDTPYNLRDCAYMSDFDLPKIVFAETMRVHKGEDLHSFPRFAYDKTGFITDKTCSIATGSSSKYLLGFLNSELGRYQIRRSFAVLDSGGFNMQKIHFRNLFAPVPHGVAQKEEVEHIVDEIIKLNCLDEPTGHLESDLDKLFYDLFSLTRVEIDFIENAL